MAPEIFSVVGAHSLCVGILDDGPVTGEAVKSVHQLSRSKRTHHHQRCVGTTRLLPSISLTDAYFLNAAASSPSRPS